MKMMYYFVLFVLAVATAEGKQVNGVYNYHLSIGIHEAARIKASESQVSDPLQNDQRIVGGAGTNIGVIPYQAGLIITFLAIFTSICGGTVINDNTVLTAAHCNSDGVVTSQSITVVMGSTLLFSGGTRVQMQSFIQHPGFNPHIASNDIAIMRIPRVTFGLWIQPIALPSGSELNNNFNGVTATASGYGVTRDDSSTPDFLGDSVGLLQTLSSVNLQVISNAECGRVFNVIQDHHLCTSGANGVGLCGGDAGGPLTTTINRRNVLIGINSFHAQAGCQAGYPSGYSRITSFVSWILSN